MPAMGDRWGADPTQQLWERWRRPVLITVAVVLILNQWERLASGRPFVIVTGVGIATFWISLLFTRTIPASEHRAEAEAWRAGARRGLRVFGLWTVVAVGWLVVAAVLYSLRPLNFVVPVIPALLAATQWWKYRNADRLAEVQQRAVTP